MVKFNERFDCYELLGFEPEDLLDIDPEEVERYVEKAYKNAARKIHPDKVMVTGLSEAEASAKKEEATAKFQELQRAYDIIKDPVQRAEYDKCRKKNSTPETFKPNLVPTEGLRFSGYSDEGRGFYKVYGDVFRNIYANELAFQEEKKLDSVIKPPEIGDQNMPYPAVAEFYKHWLNFKTIMDFKWEEPHDEWDLAASPNKKGVAVMERKNLKARRKARNEYNNKVRKFVQNVRRRDIRVLEMTAQREEERKKEMEEEKERRRKLKQEKMEKAMEYEEPEWTKPVERKRKYAVEEKEEVLHLWECPECRKEFKSEKQWLNHQMSKKHKDMLALLLGLKHRDLVDDVLELVEEGDEEELELDDADEVLEGEGEEERESDSEDEVSESVNENRTEEGGEEVVDDDEEEGEEEDEMEVLEAMVARRKTVVKVGEPIFEPMATIIVVEEDEVAMDQHEEKTTENAGEKKQRRRRRRSEKSTRIKEHDDEKELKSDSGAESCIDNGSEDKQTRKKGGKKENRSKRNATSNGESEDSGVKNSKSGSRIGYAGKKSRGDIPRRMH